MYVAAAAMFLQKGTHNNTYRKEAELESSQGSLGAGGDGEKETGNKGGWQEILTEKEL